MYRSTDMQVRNANMLVLNNCNIYQTDRVSYVLSKTILNGLGKRTLSGICRHCEMSDFGKNTSIFNIFTVNDRLLRKRSKETAYLSNEVQKPYRQRGFGFSRISSQLALYEEVENWKCFENCPSNEGREYLTTISDSLSCAVVTS